MRISLCLIWSMIPLAAAAAKRKFDPKSWRSYDIVEPHPPFPPPDLGPLYLPDTYLDDCDLTTAERVLIKKRNRCRHTTHQKAIARQWRKTGKRPTEQELEERAQDIRKRLGEICPEERRTARNTAADAPPNLRPSAEIKILEKEIKTKTKLLANLSLSGRRDLLEMAKQRLQNAEVIVDYNTLQISSLESQIRENKARQQAVASIPQSDPKGDIERWIGPRERKLSILGEEKRQAELFVRAYRKRIGAINAQLEWRPQQMKKVEAEIKELKDKLEGLREINADSCPAIDDQTEDENNVPITGMENGVRQLIQGVGGLIQDVNQRVSAEGGNIRVPSARTLPKPGPMGVP